MKLQAWKAGLFGALALASFAPAAQADGDEGVWGPFSGGVAVTSDYRFRGISQSDRDAAAQGWLQYDYKNFFFNVWASSIDFNDESSYDSSVEVDLTLGYNHQFSEQTSGGIKAIYYWYPDADTPPLANDYDYFELMATLSHDFGVVSVAGELAWSPDFFLETGDAVSLKGGVTYPVMDKFLFMGALAASANVGYQWIDDNATYGTPDYLYFDIGATASWEIFSIDLRWVDTDLDNGECFVVPNTDFCEGGVVLSLSAALPG